MQGPVLFPGVVETMEGLNIKSKGSNVYVKRCRVCWQPELKEKWRETIKIINIQAMETFL